jgi:hypothetical protein
MAFATHILFHASPGQEKIAEKMSHAVADCFQVKERGFVREGYFADLVLVDMNQKVKVSKENILYKCGWSPFEKANDSAARALGLQPLWFRVSGPTPDLQAAFAAMTTERAEALLVLEVPVNLSNLKPTAELAASHRLPTMFPGGWANDGLITYGTSILNATPRIPSYVDKILKGAKAGQMPIEVITKRELIFNLKTALVLGVTIPSDLLNRADRVIQ